MSDKRYGVTYSNPHPDGAGAVGLDFKPDRVNVPCPDGSCFANMQSAADLETHKSTASGYHDAVTRTIVAHGRIRGEQQAAARFNDEAEVVDVPDFDLSPKALGMARSVQVKPKQKVKAQAVSFSRGMEVFDRVEGKRGIIIQASVGYTAKSHSPVHKVCSSKGKIWLAKQYNLKRVF